MKASKQWEKHNGTILDSKNGFDVIDCAVCGFKHIVPIPTTEELENIYRHKYYTDEKPLYLERYQEDLDWWNLVYSERYDTFEENIDSSRRRILDVGSGPGYFLLHGKQRGWDVLGIEPSAQAAAHGRELGIEIVDAFLTDETASHLGQFDVVHMSLVLEHIPDPANLLNLVWNLLTPGGFICVTVPNDYNPFQQTLRTAQGYQPWWVTPPHHLNYFTPDSLCRLLENCGFSIELCEATFPIDVFLMMGDNYVGNDILGRECHEKRKQFEINLKKMGLTDLKRSLYQVFAELGLGREVVVFAQKIINQGG